jgi:hypothetical protein
MVNGFEIKLIVKSNAIEVLFKSNQYSQSGLFEWNWLVDPKWPRGFENNFNATTFHNHFYFLYQNMNH